MSFRPVGIRFLFYCLPLALALSGQATARGQECATGGCGAAGCGAGGCASCGRPCQRFHCPLPFKHCQEGPPRICIKCGCPRPVCNPCELPHWGYFQPCWRMWPYPPDWSHCPYPTPASLVAPPPPGMTMQGAPVPQDSGTLPTPRRLGVQPGF